MKNYYDILGIDPGATQGQIKKAYRRLSTKFHPDKNPKDTDRYFENMFKSILEAFEILSDLDKRAKYDKEMPHANTDNSVSYDSSGLSIGAKIVLNSLRDVVATEQLLSFLYDLKNINWDKVFTQSIFSLKNENLVGKPISFVGTISSISQPFPLIVDKKKHTVCSIILQDHSRSGIDCFSIPYESFESEISEHFSNHRFVVFRGTIISIGDPTNSYYFYLHDIEPRVTPDDLINLRLDPKGRVANKFKKMSKKGNLLGEIKKTIVNEMGIMGLDKATELNVCLDFMILQSFSHGKTKKASMKLHSLVVGAPGVGKKLLTLTAKILNPISEEISSTDGKITISGLVGSSVKAKGGGTKSIPGYLPRASSGVLCIQDFHEVRKNRKAIFSLLSKMMEDGEVIDSTSAGWTHEAVTSIHLDTNKYSQVGLSKESNSIKDIDIPTNILSRFDFIIDIPRDIERQYEIAHLINKGEKTLSSYGVEETEAEWKRDLQRIVAYVRTYFIDISVPSHVTNYISTKIKLARKEYEPKFKDPGLMADIITRLIVSIQKHVKAIASAHLRLTAKKSDVDYAFELIKHKLDYLSSLESGDAVIQAGKVKRFTKNDRIKLIQENFEGKIIYGKMVLDIYEDYPEFIVDLNKRTIVRDLNTVGKKIKQGQWKIPSKL